MSEVFSYTQLSDGQRIFLGAPQIGESGRDDAGYQWFDTFDDEYMENKVGSLGISASGTVAAMWGFSEVEDPRKTLSKIMRLALPLLKLPITSEQYSSMPAGYFPVIELHSEGNVSYDEKNRRIYYPSGNTPEEFFKQVVFNGKLDDNAVKNLILVHGYIGGLNDEFGDFRFFSVNIIDDLWPINSARITKAFRTLVDDNFLRPMGVNTSSGFPSFTKIPSHTRRIIEDTTSEAESDKQDETENAPENVDASPYISNDNASKIIANAASRGFETTKLSAIISELNDAVARYKPQSSHALIRALLDHIAPLFSKKNFGEVANNYSWNQTDKNRIQQLDTLFRFDADESLHAPISKRNTAADMHTIGIIRRTINVVIEEASNQTS